MLKFSNTAASTLASAIGTADTTIALKAGDGVKFPSMVAGDWYAACLIDSANNLEIVKVTARSVDSLTVVRAQESTTAKAFAAGAYVEHRVTQAMLEELAGAMVPLFSVFWCPTRNAVPAGFVLADGQLLSRTTYPDAWAGIQAGSVPITADSVWLSTITNRGGYTPGDGSTTFRVPDLNGKSAGSLGACFLRGDGALSAGGGGVIQQDALQNHDHYMYVDGTVGINKSATISGTGNSTYCIQGLPNGFTSLVTANGNAPNVRANLNETRPLNATGAWIIKLFGTVINVGAADAAQLATDIANLQANKANLAGGNSFTGGYNNFSGLQLTGTYTYLMGDFSTTIPGDAGKRHKFRSNVTNGQTLLTTVPNGSSSTSGFQCCNLESPDNANRVTLNVLSSMGSLSIDKLGTAVSLPFTFNYEGIETGRFTTNKLWMFGNNNPDPVTNKVAEMMYSPTANLYVFSAGNQPCTLLGTAGNMLASFYYNGANQIGSISTNGSAVSYNTTSDHRLKENIEDADVEAGYQRVIGVRVRSFNFIADPNTPIPAGFIAHELQALEPGAVTGMLDQMEAVGDLAMADGEIVSRSIPRPVELLEGQTWTATGERPVYQGVDSAKLVPDLVLAIQRLSATIEDLNVRITALGG